MAELKSKVELKDKGEEANLPEIKQAVVTLGWQSDVDLDLMAFIEKKDGSNHGVFTDNLNGDMGNLNAFPFMTLSEDAGVGATGGDNQEVIKMTKIDDTINKIRFVALNYTDAKNKNPDASFSQYGGKINFMNETGEAFEVDLNSEEKGTVALIATIDNSSPIGAKISNDSKVMDLDTFLSEIPGADAITK